MLVSMMTSVNAGNNCMENGYYRLFAVPAGAIVRIYQQKAHRM